VRRYGDPSTLTTLEITKAREEINRGDRLAPARESSFPSYIPHAPDKPIKGSIMSVDGGVAELGQYQIISLNRGSRDGLEIGHVLASYRRGVVVDDHRRITRDLFGDAGRWFGRTFPVGDPGSARAQDAPSNGGAIRLPDERNGLVFVFRVFEKMSYAMVVKATKPIYVGDIVQTP
jgi:hypothetical protein